MENVIEISTHPDYCWYDDIEVFEEEYGFCSDDIPF